MLTYEIQSILDAIYFILIRLTNLARVHHTTIRNFC